MAWRYIAQRMTGDGPGGEFLDFELPLEGAEIEEVLSGHNSLSGRISPQIARLVAPDGRPLLDEWGTAIWAEDDNGLIRGGGLLSYSGFDGPDWSLECTDISGVTIDLPYSEANFWINIDACDIYREIWRYVQRQPRSNFGITIDPTMSGKLLGGDLIQKVEFDLEPEPAEPPAPVPTAPNPYANNAAWIDAGVAALKAGGWPGPEVRDTLQLFVKKDDLVQQGKWPGLTDRQRRIRDRTIEKIGLPPSPPMPYAAQIPVSYIAPAPTTPGQPPPVVWEYDAYKLAWYKDHDLDGTISDLAQMTPFDWHMTHRWLDDEIRHHIRVGAPRLGRRRDDLRFVIGENVHIVPSVTRDGTEYANEVLFLGAGEGSSQISARAFRSDGRIRRVAVVADSSVQDQWVAHIRAEDELRKRAMLDDLTEIIIEDHPHAPMGSVDLGDEILIEGETGWIDLEIWARVVSRRFSPGEGNRQVLSILRSPAREPIGATID